MPRKYIRKPYAKPRSVWSEEQLSLAIEKVRSGEISMREAHKCYGVPARTIARRIASGKFKKGRLGPEGTLGEQNEKRLVAHIQKLCAAGLAPDREAVRKLAFEFAEKLNIKHNFSREKQMAGCHWFLSFMERNPELCLTPSEGVPLVITKDVGEEDTKEYSPPTEESDHSLFSLLPIKEEEEVLEECSKTNVTPPETTNSVSNPVTKKRKPTLDENFVQTCSTSALSNEMDEFDVVGKNVAMKLRNMTFHQTVLAESLIQQILTKGLFDELTRSTVVEERGLFMDPLHTLTSNNTPIHAESLEHCNEYEIKPIIN